jgi:hypothetical protein
VIARSVDRFRPQQHGGCVFVGQLTSSGPTAGSVYGGRASRLGGSTDPGGGGGDMKRALVALVLLGVAACTMTGREVLLTVDGVPVTVVSGRQTCIEVGDDDGGSGSWCGPDGMPEAVWLGAASAGQRLVVAGQAPDEVASVTLTSADGTIRLDEEQSRQGRVLVALDVPPGDYEVTAERDDGSEYLSGELLLGREGTTMFSMTP